MKKKVVAFAVKLIVTVGLFTLLFRPDVFGFREDQWGGETNWIETNVLEQDITEAGPKVTVDSGPTDSGAVPVPYNRLRLKVTVKDVDCKITVERSDDGQSWEPHTVKDQRWEKKSKTLLVYLPESESRYLRATLHDSSGKSRALEPEIGLFRGLTFGVLIEELREVETHSVVFWLTFAIVVKLLGMLAGVLRWRLLLRGQGLHIPFWYLVQSWFIGRIIGVFLPGTIGLDGYRLYDSTRYTGEVIKTTTVIAVEKLIGVIALTLLVFITFPMGMSLLSFKLPVLIICMTVFGGFVVVSLLTLLNPHLIQILMAVIPTPGAVRGIVNKLGTAATSYSRNRGTLLLAVVFGILVHVGTCLMYFGTMSAIRTDNTTIFDIFFTSPIMIWGTVLGPSVGGEGIREIVFTTLLGAKSGTAKAFLMAHLGWWVGEFIPLIIGLPIYVLRSRPSKDELQTQLAEARSKGAKADDGAHLSHEEVREYRNKLINCVLAGLAGGLIGGAILGLGEAQWATMHLSNPSELSVWWWAPLVHGLLFTGCGLAVAAFFTFFYLILDRFIAPFKTFALSLGGTIFIGTTVIGIFLLKRDVLGGHNPAPPQMLKLAGSTLGIGLAIAAVFMVISCFLPKKVSKRTFGCAAAILAYLALIICGATINATHSSGSEGVTFQPKPGTNGPNIILIGIDTLRADYLSTYSENAEPKTPTLEAFAKDSVLFKNCFAQASWTKPSFATLFTGLYPESHTATSKESELPDEVVTAAEMLEKGGYYTEGYSNNPNITAFLNFQQGFTKYTDLKPDLCFGAPASAERTTVYQILRKIRLRFLVKKMVVTDFYQPAEKVTQIGLDWFDKKEVPQGTPFYLFLHYMDPHDPFMDPDSKQGGYARAKMENPDADEFLEPMRNAYIREIEHLDKHLGILFDGLKKRGVYDDTAIIFVSDHGEEFYDHNGWWHGQTLYDEQIFIPLIVKLPRNKLAGTVNTDLARHVDVTPTILSLAGLAPDPSMQGKSLFTESGVLSDNEVGFIYSENDFEGIALQSVRTMTEKIINANEGNKRDLKSVEFYNVAEDPKELNNIVGSDTEKESELQGLINDMQSFIKENAAEPSMVESLSEIEDQLGGLGYLGD